MTSLDPDRRPSTPPPTRHEMAVMIWIAVVPTLTVLNLALGRLLADTSVIRIFVRATIAVPIVIYWLIPLLQHLRTRLLPHRIGAAPRPPPAARRAAAHS